MLKEIAEVARGCIAGYHTPRYVLLNVTHRCNSRCIHCSLWKTRVVEHEVTPEEVERILSQELFSGVREVIISGGEPFIRTDIPDVIRAIHRALPKAVIQVSTNGFLSDRIVNGIREVLEDGIPLRVGVSVDGLRENHDKIRGEGAWEKLCVTLDNLMFLRDEYGSLIDLYACTVVMEDNLDDIYWIEKWTQCLGIGHIIQWMQNDVFHDNFEYDYDREKEREVVESLDPVKYGFFRECWLRWLDTRETGVPCQALKSFIIIRPDGYLVPCFRYYTWVIGNLIHEPAEKIWDSWWRDRALETVKNCPGCVNPIGFYWSAKTLGWPYVKHYLKNPRELVAKVVSQWV